MLIKHFVMGLLLPPFAAIAVDSVGSVSMQVSILDNTCSVDAKLGNVVLGSVALRDIQNRGGTSVPVQFPVVLNRCGLYAKKVSIYAKGVTVTGKENALALNGEGSGETAEDVGVWLLDAKKRVVAINQPDRPITESLTPGGDTVIGFSAQYVLTGDNPRSGQADSDLTLTFAYE
ncbi:type 1 fimbria pilin [Enterobacter asburiae]|uniref:fimbrial protein n=1 Tax=Enterobacter asburiae TaxID=61645 RepID=UPI00141A75E4|nr:fimbrial protein [Enterobacter asburiae]NIH92203.1 type 1 fimbria pilin [Enterobacter asburiae]